MSGFNISIKAGKDKGSSSVTVTGSVQHVISDEERSTFQLNDDQLKQAVGKYFGKRPLDAYLHSPTPWNDLYKVEHWDQTQTVITATSAEILEITSQPVALKTQTFANSSSHDATFNVSITDSVSDTTTSSWQTGGTLTVGQTIKYQVEFFGSGGGGETSMSYSQSWGVGGSESKSMTIGSTAGATVTLKPGQSVVATLSASQGKMKVQVRYNSHLIGTTAINYNPRYKGHHFWDLDVPTVMATSDIVNSIESTETMELGYFSNGKIEVKDKDTNELLYTEYLSTKPGDRFAKIEPK